MRWWTKLSWDQTSCCWMKQAVVRWSKLCLLLDPHLVSSYLVSSYILHSSSESSQLKHFNKYSSMNPHKIEGLVSTKQVWFLLLPSTSVKILFYFTGILVMKAFIRGASISPNPRLPSFRKYWAPISPNAFCLGSHLSEFNYGEGSNFSEFLDFFQWPFLTSKCQNFEKSYNFFF